MKALSCPKCGAPIEVDETTQAPTLRCPFCRSTLAPTRTMSAAGAPVVIDLRHVTRAGAAAARWVGVVLLVVLAITGVSLWIAFDAARSGVDRIPKSLGIGERSAETATARRAARPLAELESLTRADAWQLLELAPPAGGLAAFDPAAERSWAMNVGQAWRADVLLERIDVTRLRPDGTVNLVDDREASAMYRFVSPQAIELYTRQARQSTRVEAETGLFVKIEGGQVRALVVEARADDLPPDAPDRILDTRDLLARLRRDERFAEVPFFTGYLIRLEREGWVWYLSPLAGKALPRVRASDGKPWPYK